MIPKIMHFFWGGKPMPDEFRYYMRRWEELHPQWEIKLWSPETIPPMRNQDMFDHPEKWSHKSNIWQWRSDLFRYEILYDQGGLYIDTDLEPFRPIDELVEGADVTLGRESPKFIANGFFASRPQSALLEDLLHGLEERVRRMWDCRVNKSVGPQYVTDLVPRHPEVRILPQWVLYPYHWSELEREAEDFSQTSYAVHHWNNLRKTKYAVH